MDSLIEKLKIISQSASEAILEVYQREELFNVELKKDDSPLTLADKRSNDIIVAGLNKLSEGYPIISEENKLVDYAVRKEYHRFWLVDPLDGTKEFIKRNGEFTVNIALIEEGSPIMGIVQVPVTGEIFWAVKGEGAYYSNGEVRKRLRANRFTMSDRSLRVVCSRSHSNPETLAYIDRLNEPLTVSKGSSLKFLILAEGEAELYPRIGPTMEWDTAAAQIILEESGGTVVEFGTDHPLRYNKSDLLNPYFVAMADCRPVE